MKMYKFFRSFIKYSCIKYDKRNFSEIPSPRKFPIFDTFLPLLLSNGGEKLHEYIDDQHKKFGPIFRQKIGPITSIFISDIELIRKVFANEGKYPKHVLPDSWRLYNEIKSYRRGLYFMDGEEWFKYRKILNNILLKKNFFVKINNDFFEKYFETWLENSYNGELINLEKQLYELSLIFMSLYLVGTPFSKNAHLFLSSIDQLASVVHEIFRWSVKLSVMPVSLAKRLNLKSWVYFVNAIDTSVKISSELLNVALSCNGDGILRDMLDEGIPLEIIRNIVVDFILAAGDTTATTIQWTLYLLGKSRSIQEQLFLELKNNENIEKVMLLKNVLKESMRMYPVAPFITRYLPQETQMSTYLIPSNELISISMYTCGRCEQYFPNPNLFQPSRWERTAGNIKYVSVNEPFASLPYASGSRSCIGRKMAHAQMLTTISKIILMYEVHAINTVKIKLNLITIPSEPVRLFIRKRK